MNKKKIEVLLFFGLFLLTDIVYAQKNTVVKDEHQKMQEFLLSAYNPPGTSTATPPYADTLFIDYKNAGFDNFLWIYDDDSLLQKIHQYGFKYFVNIQSIGNEDDDIEFLLRGENEEAPPDITENLLQELDTLVDKYKDDPDLLGYYICDEPFASGFDNIAKVVARIREKDPTRICYVNLWSYFVNEEGDNTPVEGDENYIENFIQKTNIDLLSSDRYNFYNLLEDGDYDDNEEYFNQIERIRKKALKYDIPFCNIVQAVGTNGTSVSWDSQGDGEHLDWRTPSKAEHRWLVYSSLAYGVHGIVWFHWDCCDWGVIENPDRDSIYPSLQSINQEIDSLKQIMFGLKTKNVYHLNGKQISRLTNTPDIILEASQNISLIAGSFENENDNENYFMLMNKDYYNSVSAQIKINYLLNNFEVFNVNDNIWEIVPFETESSGDVFDINLRAGGGKLYRFNGNKLAPSEFDFSISPNPFETSTTISYSVPEMYNGENYHNIKLNIYDLQGKKVAELVNEKQAAGKYFVEIKANSLSGGVYLCTLNIDEEKTTKKITVLN